MQRSLLTRSMVEDLLRTARRLKEEQQQLMPLLLYTNSTGKGNLLPLPDLAADAEGRRAQFFALGKRLPDVTEAVYICEAWFLVPDRTADAFKVAPREHPCRQEAIIISGRNRTNSKSVFAIQPFSQKGKRISWQSPQISTEPGCTEGLIDPLFAP